jgi:hypothetical protein
MEERGSEAGYEEFISQTINLRIGTYNILNTKGNGH